MYNVKVTPIFYTDNFNAVSRARVAQWVR